MSFNEYSSTMQSSNDRILLEFEESTITDIDSSLIINDLEEFTGTWEEVKEISESKITIYEKLGFGGIKRRALSNYLSKICVNLKSKNENGIPIIDIMAYYPLGITKKSTFTPDGFPFETPDVDTCHWTSRAIWNNGYLIQKRIGDKGVMYDLRCLIKCHPTGMTSKTPLMLFQWSLIEPNGMEHRCRIYLQKIK